MCSVLSSALALVLSVMIGACEQGLSPPGVAGKPVGSHGIRGRVIFSHWPPADSVLDLRIAALQHYPVQSIVAEVLAGRAAYSDQVPYGIDTLEYQLLLNQLPPGTIPFIGVAQRYGPNIQTDWRVVGEYYANGDTTMPGSVVVPADSIVPDIDMVVDFSHIPPQP
jgi:hypothetical protein